MRLVPHLKQDQTECTASDMKLFTTAFVLSDIESRGLLDIYWISFDLSNAVLKTGYKITKQVVQNFK